MKTFCKHVLLLILVSLSMSPAQEMRDGAS